MKKHYDIIIVGTGAGLTIADYAAKNGYKVAIVEKGPFGGTCVNRGCIPSKMLIYPSDLMHKIHSSKKLNIEVENVKANFYDLVQRVTETIDSLAKKIQSHYNRSETIDVYPDKGKFTEKGQIEVNGALISGDRFYLAIGARPKIPDIDGLEKTPYFTSTEALRCSTQPKKIAIIGGGFIAAELAHFYSSMGTEVEIFSRSEFLKKMDEELRKPFLDQFRKRHTIHEFASVRKVSYKDNEFTLEYEEGEEKIIVTQAENLIIAIGREACTDNIGIENTRIQTDKAGFIQVDDFLKTKAENIWALGDCIGRHLFRHMANFEANYLVKQLLGNEKGPILYPPIPFAIFTHPQIGVVGKTEQALKNEGRDLFIGVSEYADSGMGRARQSTCGLVKLIFDRGTKHLMSAHIMGDEAATMIHILIAFIQMKAKLEHLTHTVFIHPALPEIISSAAHDARKKISEPL